MKPKSRASAMCSKSPAMRAARRRRGKALRTARRRSGTRGRKAFSTGAVWARCPKPWAEISTSRCTEPQRSRSSRRATRRSTKLRAAKSVAPALARRADRLVVVGGETGDDRGMRMQAAQALDLVQRVAPAKVDDDAVWQILAGRFQHVDAGGAPGRAQVQAGGEVVAEKQDFLTHANGAPCRRRRLLKESGDSATSRGCRARHAAEYWI
jgi:hypothetical protein